MSVISEAQFSAIVQPGLKAVIKREFNDLPMGSLIQPLYKVGTSDLPDEDYREIEDLGSMPEFTGELAFTEFKQGNSKTLTHKEFAVGVKIQRKLMDDDQYNVIEDMVGQLGEVARYRMEQDAAGPFVNAFNSTYTVFDALSLCNDSHSFVSTGTTQDNAGSTAFSYAALDATIILMRKFKNSQDRFVFTMNPDMLVGGVDLETQFWEVINSKLKPGTANNNANAFFQKFTAMTTQFITDSNDWFLVDSKKMKKYLIWLQRIPLEFKNAGEFNTFTKMFAAYMRYSNSPIHWLWVYGHQVS